MVAAQVGLSSGPQLSQPPFLVALQTCLAPQHQLLFPKTQQTGLALGQQYSLLFSWSSQQTASASGQV